MRALVTGAAGFIGSHVVDSLVADGIEILGIDNLDPAYAPSVKRANLAAATGSRRLRLLEADVLGPGLAGTLAGERFDVLVHLAGKTGVRGSVADPGGYQRVNVLGTQAMLELARALEIPRFVFASSSSVYGENPDQPWREDAPLQPVSPYGCSKGAGELLTHAYHRMYGIRCVVLRLFTVYGPRQRPDLAIHSFATRLLAGQPVTLFGDGTAARDYTHVGDVTRAIRAAMALDSHGHEIVNVGNGRPVTLDELVRLLEAALGMTAPVEHVGKHRGDVPRTWASIGKAKRLLGYEPATRIEQGLEEFVAWLGAGDVRSSGAGAATTSV